MSQSKKIMLMKLLHRSLKFGESCKKEDTKKLLHSRAKKMFSVDRKKITDRTGKMKSRKGNRKNIWEQKI